VKISQKLEYACRATVQLAKSKNYLLRIEEIAQRENVSSNFLVQILNSLRSAGIIQSKRGKHGGYFLERNPQDISLYEIIKAVNSGVVADVTVKDGDSAEQVANTWIKISLEIDDLLKKTSLQDMLGNENTYMYYI
jgi:Rrf2 family transcriptional regulator, cysteine metabolism repressor